MGEHNGMHDWIAGALILPGTLLRSWGGSWWLLLPGAVGALMLQCASTGFCPVYFTLGKPGRSQAG